MNELQVFENAQFGQVRIIEENGKPLFCGSDVAKALGYMRPADALAQHCKGSVKRRLLTAGGEQDAKFIPEGDVYRLIARSKLPAAERFEKWVFDEVLPSIRKNGGYIAGQETMTDDELLANALMVAQRKIAARDKQIEVQEKQIEAMHPKALFADAVSASKTSILIGDLAKLLKQNGVDIGQKRLFQWLRENKYLISQKGASYNSPTQRSMEMKLFEVKETTITHADGHITINRTAKVTGKGQVYFINKFVGKS
nr:MAG TPA: repressor domain protein [Caudoviricetes sp.]